MSRQTHPFGLKTRRGISTTPQTNGEAAFQLVATVAADPDLTRFDIRYLTERWPSITPYSLYQTLSSIPGVKCEISDGVAEFETVPKRVGGESIRDEYTKHLVDRCSAIQSRIDTLSRRGVDSPAPNATESVVVQDYEMIDSGAIAPTYFTYTLINPDALGEQRWMLTSETHEGSDEKRASAVGTIGGRRD